MLLDAELLLLLLLNEKKLLDFGSFFLLLLLSLRLLLLAVLPPLKAATDWVVTKADETSGAVSNDWKTYRQALRDLPASASPQLDDNENLTNVTWPTKPS